MNNLTMTGNLTRDPQLRHVDGRAICDLRLAVDNGRHATTYIDVSTFDEQAYSCSEFLAKGRKVGVEGRLVYGEWTSEDGSRHSRHSVIGRVEFLGVPPIDEGTTVPAPDAGDVGGRPEPVRG